MSIVNNAHPKIIVKQLLVFLNFYQHAKISTFDMFIFEISVQLTLILQSPTQTGHTHS